MRLLGVVVALGLCLPVVVVTAAPAFASGNLVTWGNLSSSGNYTTATGYEYCSNSGVSCTSETSNVDSAAGATIAIVQATDGTPGAGLEEDDISTTVGDSYTMTVAYADPGTGNCEFLLQDYNGDYQHTFTLTHGSTAFTTTTATWSETGTSDGPYWWANTATGYSTGCQLVVGYLSLTDNGPATTTTTTSTTSTTTTTTTVPTTTTTSTSTTTTLPTTTTTTTGPEDSFSSGDIWSGLAPFCLVVWCISAVLGFMGSVRS